jgi:DNA mismatch endonuclease, patch repair protein
LTDIVDPETRSRIMRAVPRSSTKPELALRRRLHAKGLRYVLGRRDLPGSPDLVLPRWRAVVFVHGCFWHRHKGCSRATTPKTRQVYWLPKFARNVTRDRDVTAALESDGWRVAVVWECELTARKADATADRLARWIRDGEPP